MGSHDSQSLVCQWSTGISSKAWSLRELKRSGRESLRDTRSILNINSKLVCFITLLTSHILADSVPENRYLLGTWTPRGAFYFTICRHVVPQRVWSKMGHRLCRLDMSNIACGFAFWSDMGIHGTLSVYLYLFSFSNKKVWTQSQVWIYRIGPKIGMENKVPGGVK